MIGLLVTWCCGDLVRDHLLVDEHTGHLTGIIDFSDVALGDPAQDFLGFWGLRQGRSGPRGRVLWCRLP